MATLRQIKEQQNSVKTINKITSAMKLVSSAKSQKAIKQMKNYRDYFSKVQGVMSDLSNDKEQGGYDGSYWILIMSDLGLAGGYNHNLLKTLQANMLPEDRVLVLGNKGTGFAKRNKDKTEWFSLGNILQGNMLAEITTRIKTQHYDKNREVKIIYTEFESQVEFMPVAKTLLPIQPIEKNEDENKTFSIIEYEPDRETLLKELEELYIESFLIGVYRESQASEHTARKNAMENASNNGEELLEKLNIEYNRGRQAKITQEISEIIGGAESLK